MSMWKEKLAADVARKGDLEQVITEINNGIVITEWTSAMAIVSGNMELIQWLFNTQNICWNPWLCAMASKYGHLDLLIWCREHGCPWDSETCSNAAKAGHLEILKYARSNGCPWNSDTFNYVRHYHGYNSDIFKWVKDNNCPTDKGDTGDKCTCKELDCKFK